MCPVDPHERRDDPEPLTPGRAEAFAHAVDLWFSDEMTPASERVLRTALEADIARFFGV